MEANELSISTEGNQLRTLAGVQYADFLISMERIDDAFELTKQNLWISQRYNWTNSISRCHRCLGAIERVKGNYEEAENHLQDAVEIARKVGMPFLEVEAMLESGRLGLDLGRYEDAVRDADNVLKICGRTGFRFYEPGAEVVLAKAYLGQKDFDQAESNAKSAYEKAVGMKYRWAEGDAADLLGEIYSVRGDKANGRKWLKKVYSVRGDKANGRKWLKKAVGCRKEILDPKVKETEGKLKIKD
ncbi:MAG: tetratricopeptide repeat protein [Planctomycetota bacterium]